MREFNNLYSLISFLRSDKGCPWDKKQTIRSLKKFLVEELYELLDAIDKDSCDEIVEEIGDIFLNLMMIIVILEEQKKTNLKEILKKLNNKIVARHPHVFGTKKALTHLEASKHWEIHKKFREGKKIFGSIPKNAPALQKAYMMSKKAEKVGFGFENVRSIKDKVNEEIKELYEAIDINNHINVEHEIGDVLISIATLGLYLDINPEIALQKACKRFMKRFEYIEKEIEKMGKNIFEVPREMIEKLWEKSKLKINI
ncbi:MAG: nucleoside triphosphate pyrophosphohydrolase [Proteobacteria bacterium]|nr:nucleoside triphosphate pyrophosphohydrolase [Pseudomonadota bacterium]